mmetsp:Transcript_12498/g.22624  ORF Transcript_12498/g.22624 Transcript_12498/m.22624 type:complete len:85 (-) Transcript_12498:263-517(-)
MSHLNVPTSSIYVQTWSVLVIVQGMGNATSLQHHLSAIVLINRIQALDVQSPSPTSLLTQDGTTTQTGEMGYVLQFLSAKKKEG